MLDINSYRIRIGLFNFKTKHPKRSKSSETNDASWFETFRKSNWKPDVFSLFTGTLTRMKSRKLSFCILILLTAVWIPTDDRSGKNRQRGGFSNFKYQSDREKQLFNDVRTLERNLCRTKSHLEFFSWCKSSGVHPTNMEYNGNFNVAFAKDSMERQLRKIDTVNINEKILLCINHFKIETARFTEEIAVAKSKLKSDCNPDRFTALITKLDQHRKKTTAKLIINTIFQVSCLIHIGFQTSILQMTI